VISPAGLPSRISRRTVISPAGCGTVPETRVSLPRCGRTTTFFQPGEAESTPSTVRSSSMLGLDPQAWHSERTRGPDHSAQVVEPCAIISRQVSSMST